MSGELGSMVLDLFRQSCDDEKCIYVFCWSRNGVNCSGLAVCDVCI